MSDNHEERRAPEDLRRLIEHIERGRIVLAPPPEDAYLLQEFVERFARDILEAEWKHIGATGESSVLDFLPAISEAEARARIERLYGVDCSDLPGLNLWIVMSRCAERMDLTCEHDLRHDPARSSS